MSKSKKKINKKPSKSKHTPGPWIATTFMGTYGGPDTWGVLLSNNTGITPMTEANAALIAAAPEMYDEIKTIIGGYMNPGGLRERLAPAEREQMSVYIGRLMNVIAKAEGKE